MIGLEPFAPPPGLREVLLGWHPFPQVVVPVVVAGWVYSAGVRRLRLRGQPWPRGRSASFYGGLAAILVALTSSLETYADALFSVHVVQHTILTMVAPPLLALGTPITLALRAASPPAGRRIVRVVRSRPVAFLGHPVLAWTLFTFTLYGLYFTPLFDLSLRNQAVHQAIHVHFLAVGLLFWWPVVGLDPTRWRLSHPARLLYFLLMLPFHAFLGLSIMSSDVLMAPSLGLIARTWGPSPLADQHAAGAILWASGDLLSVVAAAGIMIGWMAHDQRVAEREDRRLDRARSSGAASPSG